jgi:uncharacterized protein YuzE
MIKNSPKGLPEETRELRFGMIKMIAELSQTYKQKKLDTKIYIDVDEKNNICGMDMSELMDVKINMTAKRYKLAELTRDDWINMKIMH